jgi:hypothetical protein
MVATMRERKPTHGSGGAVMVYEINEVNDRPVGKPQDKVLMNIAASFPSVKKPRYVDQEKSRQYD